MTGLAALEGSRSFSTQTSPLGACQDDDPWRTWTFHPQGFLLSFYLCRTGPLTLTDVSVFGKELPEPIFFRVGVGAGQLSLSTDSVHVFKSLMCARVCVRASAPVRDSPGLCAQCTGWAELVFQGLRRSGSSLAGYVSIKLGLRLGLRSPLLRVLRPGLRAGAETAVAGGSQPRGDLGKGL